MAPGSKEEGAKYQEKLKQSNEEGDKAQKFRKYTYSTSLEQSRSVFLYVWANTIILNILWIVAQNCQRPPVIIVVIP